MCVVCTSLRPWSHDCAYAGADDGPRSVGSPVGGALSTAAIGQKLLTDYWAEETPRSFDARAGDTLTFDVTGLNGAGKTLARAALEEWGTATGLRFKEVKGGFRPDARHSEAGDAAASKATTATIGLNDSFAGRIGPGDRDWVRLDLPSAGTVKVVVEGAGGIPLGSPGLSFYDALGRAIPLGVQHFQDRAEVVLGIKDGGGTYYAQVRGLDGRTGGYDISVRQPGATGSADITFDDDRPGAYANTVYSDGEIISADVNVSRGWLAKNGDEIGTYGFQTYLHEIGHALGLGHPGDYGGDARFGRDAEFANDSWQTTVMSYFGQHENPHVRADKAYLVTPMAADLAAAASLYGGAGIRGGNTVYGESSTAGGALDLVTETSRPVAFTIADSGGHDRVDFYRERASQRIDLREGATSDVMGERGAMTIAEGTLIEDARTGSGNDVLRGNRLDNELRGGSGHDRLIGSGGEDVLLGQRGDDTLKGGRGEDLLKGGSGRDVLKGGSGDDVLRGQKGRDKLIGGGGDDVLEGGSSKDVLKGRSGDDLLEGGKGKDRLYGNGGEDRLDGGSSKDRLKGGSGDDLLDGGRGKDILYGGKGADVFVLGRSFHRDKIKDFDVDSGDLIDVSELRAIRSWDDLRDDHLFDRGSRVVLKAGGDGKAKLEGVDLEDLTADHFLF